MNSKSVLKAAASLTVAAGLALGAGSFVQAPVQAADTAKVQLADAAQMAAVKERQELMKTIGGNAKKITEFLKDSKGTAAEAEAAAAKINELAKTIPAAFEVEASLAGRDAVGQNRGKPDPRSKREPLTRKA